MIPIDLYLDLTPIATERLAVQDDEGRVASAGWRLPPLGGGVDVQFAQFERLALAVSVNVAQTSPRYDIPLDWAPTVWMGELDTGVRVHLTANDERGFYLDLDAGPGLRAELLAQPWWPDYAYAGIGGHAGLTATVGIGGVRVLAGFRGSVALVPGSVQGVLDSGLQDLTWDFARSGDLLFLPVGVRLGVHVGVGLRPTRP